MTQQHLSKVSPTLARDSDTVVETPVTENTKDGRFLVQMVTGTTLQSYKDRFAQWSTCSCPEEFLESVEPHNCGVRIISCPICQKEKERILL